MLSGGQLSGTGWPPRNLELRFPNDLMIKIGPFSSDNWGFQLIVGLS